LKKKERNKWKKKKKPCFKRVCSKAEATVLFPEAERPVNQIVKPFH